MKNVSFIPYTSFDTGTYPSIAVNAKGVVISGHQREVASKIYYNVGVAGNDKIDFNNTGTQIGKGAPPRFAINDNNLATEIHKSDGASDKIWYRVGYVNSTEKTWAPGDAHNSSNGHDPDIALSNNNTVVAVHEKDGSIKCRVGTVNTAKMDITFHDEFTIDSGTLPSVAMSNSGLVVIAYCKADGTIQCWLGQVSSSKVNKLLSINTVSGSYPSIGITEDGLVLLGYADNGNLYSKAGAVALTNNVYSITWSTELQYGYGNYPWVDAKGAYGVQVFPSDDLADYSLPASVSAIYDRASWMTDNPKIQELTLKQLVFPGSHDAGMSTHQQCTFDGTQCNTRTQFINIGGQLAMGSRYFDIRPVYYNGSFMTGHYADTKKAGIGIQGCNGQSLDSVLDEAATFLATGKEAVILKFSHYYDKDSDVLSFTTTQMTALIDLVKSKLGTYIFINPELTTRIADLKISTIATDGSKAITVFDQLGDLAEPDNGIYSYADYIPGHALNGDLTVYDVYSQSNNLDTMMADQWSKQGNEDNHGGDLFLLSWTLTQSNTQASVCGFTWMDSIVALADTAGAVLYEQCIARYAAGMITTSTIPNILYVDICNGFATDVAIYLNGLLGAK